MGVRIASVAALALTLAVGCTAEDLRPSGEQAAGAEDNAAAGKEAPAEKPPVQSSGDAPKPMPEQKAAAPVRPRVHRLGQVPKPLSGRHAYGPASVVQTTKTVSRRAGGRPGRRLGPAAPVRLGKTAAPPPRLPQSVARVQFGSLGGPLGTRSSFATFDSTPAGVTGFSLPDQTRFPRYYRFDRRWATGATCPSGVRLIRYGRASRYHPHGPRGASLACGRIEGGPTVHRGSPWAGRIPPGPTVEQGSPWASRIAPGLTVRQGSPWRSRIRGGPTVRQGSRWASHMKNWRFSAYDPARFPAQVESRPKRHVAPRAVVVKRAFPVQRVERFRSRIRPGRRNKIKRLPWRSPFAGTRTARHGSPWASRTRY